MIPVMITAATRDSKADWLFPPIGGRRESLIDDAQLLADTADLRWLLAAWEHVRARGSNSAGSDGMSVQTLAATAQQSVLTLSNELLEGRYRASAPRAFRIRKADGGARQLSIPCVRDRVVHRAICDSLGSLLQDEMEGCSFAYQAGKSVKQAIAMVRGLASTRMA